MLASHPTRDSLGWTEVENPVDNHTRIRTYTYTQKEREGDKGGEAEGRLKRERRIRGEKERGGFIPCGCTGPLPRWQNRSDKGWKAGISYGCHRDTDESLRPCSESARSHLYTPLSLSLALSPIFLFVCFTRIYTRYSSCSLSVSVGRIVEQQAYMYIFQQARCATWNYAGSSNEIRIGGGGEIYIYIYSGGDAKLFRRTTGRKKSSRGYNSLKELRVILYGERDPLWSISDSISVPWEGDEIINPSYAYLCLFFFKFEEILREKE